MKLISKILMAVAVLLSFTSCNAQIKNAKTEKIKIDGNCEMCKYTIEKAGNKKKTAKVDWNIDTKMALITFDTLKTNQNEILKRIALSGYDNEIFLAPDEIYSKLPECCKYERKHKMIEEAGPFIKFDSTKIKMEKYIETNSEISQLKAIFENYFALKDALVNTNANNASDNAKKLITTINIVKMEKLSEDEHVIWMKILPALLLDANQIVDTKDISQQREHFTTLSKNIYLLIKVSKQETPTFYQHCPMYNNGKGADWLSKENEIKNPYYGVQMLSCGKTVETIK